MDELLKLPLCTDDKLHHLRMVYDRAYAIMRGLESLGIEASQYGSFLIPVTMSKLPSDVRLQIAHVSVKDVWEVDELMTVIKREVEVRELCDTIKVTEQRSTTHSRKPFQNMASALATTGGVMNKVTCVYCKGKHYSTACEVVSDTTAHSEVLRKEGRCFLCLSKGHCMNQYTSTRKCCPSCDS